MIHARLTALAGALLLAACNNVVVTDKPLFSKADTIGAPKLRAGVWNASTPNCGFDESKPQNAWPACANPMSPITDSPSWLVIAGRPDIIQSVASTGPNAPPTGYNYLAFRVTRSNSAGKATEIQFWLVQCGPPPPANSESGLTQHLLPGLHVRKDSNNCTTTSKTVLRRAARDSEKWMGGPAPKIHWIRDPIPGDKAPDSGD